MDAVCIANPKTDMYNRQCDVIMEKLAPHIRKYARLLKRVNKLDKMTFSDMKMPLDSEKIQKKAHDLNPYVLKPLNYNYKVITITLNGSFSCQHTYMS